MFAKTNAAFKCKERIAPITGLPMTAPAGYIQCFPANGFRYWYRLHRNGSIMPNSFIEVDGVPNKQAIGASPCRYIEYKIFKKV